MSKRRKSDKIVWHAVPPDCATLHQDESDANKALVAYAAALKKAQDNYNAALQIAIAARQAVIDAGCV